MTTPRDQVLPARRSLLSQPQKLGILPTYNFWNDRERQQLVLPLVALVALPVTPLLFLLVAQLQLSVWFLLAASTLYPYLVMGLVERHIRKELRRRADGVSVPAPTSSPPGKFRDRTLLATLAVVCLTWVILTLAGVGKSVMLIAFAAGVAVSIAVSAVPRTRKVANQLDKAMRELPPGANDS